MNDKSLEIFLNSLSPLETFDKEVFVGDHQYSQDLCNFVLALALIWNDSKNLTLFHDLLRAHRPNDVAIQKPSDMPIEPIWGELSGIQIFVEKSMAALIHELFQLIRDSQNILSDPTFHGIIRQLHRHCRESWNTIIDYAQGKANTKTPLGKALLMTRHKIANHYDKGEIFKGYRLKFLTEGNIPYISRGDSMHEKRFYFADAAAQEYYRSNLEKISEKEYYRNFHVIRVNFDIAIQNLVETFIQKRSSWSTPKLSNSC